ncbi:MAG TPA: hypothetical protein VGX03_21835 [Candidatus Binatia bacterium]|nr:hypothetical protein [Candidatus Binatia bacterium]
MGFTTIGLQIGVECGEDKELFAQIMKWHGVDNPPEKRDHFPRTFSGRHINIKRSFLKKSIYSVDSWTQEEEEWFAALLEERHFPFWSCRTDKLFLRKAKGRSLLEHALSLIQRESTQALEEVSNMLEKG